MLSLRTIAQRSALTMDGTATVAATGAIVYATTEQGAGFHREVVFWKFVLPIISHYCLETASSRWSEFATPVGTATKMRRNGSAKMRRNGSNGRSRL